MPNQLNHPHTKLRHQSGKPSSWQQVALLLLSLYLLAPGTYAQAPVTLDIPAQPLGAALESLARSAGLQLVYPPELVGQRRSAGLHGEYTTEQAMSQLLEGSGLEFQMIDEHTVAVKKPEPVAQNDASKAVPKKTGQDQPTVLEEITVTASPLDETSYNALDATTATKTDTPIFDTPVSIQVVPQQVLRDQQAIRLSDALKNVSGVQPFFAFSQQREQFTLRGFNVGFEGRLFRDGFRVEDGISSLANAERVEVLKGPASVLFGRLDPGGLINIVTKRPLASPYYALEQQFGSFDTYRTTLDATGPITQDGTLAYRLNFEYLDQDSFRDFNSIDRQFIAPSLTWQPSERTQIDLDFIYQDHDGIVDSGIPAIGDRPAPIPIEWNLAEEEINRTNSKNYDTALTLTHEFNQDWKLRGRFQAQLNDGFYGTADPDSLDEATGTLERFSIFVPNYDNEVYYGTLDVTGRLSTWDLIHNLLVGADYYDATYSESCLFGKPV